MRSRPYSRRILWLTPLLALLALTAGAAGLDAQVDRTRLGENETLTLTLTADGRLSGEPDLSPLSKDFEVLGSSTGTSLTIVNGAMSQTRTWTIELAPRRSGSLEIPVLVLGAERTRPLTIEVAPSGQTPADAGPKPLYVETEVGTQSPYVQQAFEYRVRVLYRDQPRRAVLSDPEAEGATLETLGEDQSFSRDLGGQRYTVIERRYRVIPQRSGPLTIRSPRLEAVLPDRRPGSRRSPFADLDSLFGGRVFQDFPGMPDLGSGRRVIERGPDRTLEVRPQPADTGPLWLPAESVQLAEEWIPSPPHFRVGEPVTRILTITAQGATAAQLPALDPGAPQGLKVYPEAPKGEDLPASVRPAATKTLKVALVPDRAGTLTLPEIRLPWWDTVEDRARVAAIPARTVQVEPAVEASAPKVPAPQAPEDAAGEWTLPEREGAVSAPVAAGPSEGTPSGRVSQLAERLAVRDPWPWIALLLGLGWLATLVWAVWGRASRGRSAMPPTSEQSGLRRSLGSAAAAVRRACLARDPRAARSALLAWAQARWGAAAPRGLRDLAERLGGGDTRELLAPIDRAVYAQGDPGAATGWDGAATWAQLEPLLDRAAQAELRARPTPLPDLYPRGV